MRIQFFKYFQGLMIIFLFALFSLSFIHKTSFFTNVDIGRHLKNGEIVLNEYKIIKTNYYSYTEANKEVINHHWGSGVIYYLVHKAFGFKGLSILNLLLYLFTLFFIISIVVKKIPFAIILPIVLISLPLLLARPYIRPEVFSYFFLGFYFFLLDKYRNNKIRFKGLLIFLVISQIIWTNLHVLFVLGPFVILLYAIDKLLKTKSFNFTKNEFILFLLVGFSCFINANGFKGVLEPFVIRQNLVLIPQEFRHLFNLEHYNFQNIQEFTPRYIFDFFTIFVLASSFLLLLKKQLFVNFFYSATIIFFLLFAWMMNRNIAMFSFVFLLYSSQMLSIYFKKFPDKLISKVQIASIIFSVFFIAYIFILKPRYYYPIKSNFGIGINKDEYKAAKHLSNFKTTSHIFNNFDIGAYIIFNNFPAQKPFIDPRPEAYSDSFVRNIYWKIKQNKNQIAWKKIDSIYNFNVIVL
ncbi:MAG: hypothetical protein U9R42_10910, partial [Bacteroidota bacterium]|nr:hypothetical protein [Bacteroidota bacterium]